MIFPIERTSRFQAQAYGEPMEYFRLDEPVFRHEPKGFKPIRRSSVKICVANSPREIWSEKLCEESGSILVSEWLEVSCLSDAYHRSVCRFQDQSCRASWVSAVWSCLWTSIPCGHHRPVAWPGPSSYAWICCWVVRNAWFWRIGQEGHAWGTVWWIHPKRDLRWTGFRFDNPWFWRELTGLWPSESWCWRWRCYVCIYLSIQ